MVDVPATNDIIQECEGNLQRPEIRVWCHPHKIGKSGDDYYDTFESFEDAINFIEDHEEAEDAPLIAIKGYELNVFAIEERKQ